MSDAIRIALLIGAVLSSVYVFRGVKKSKLKAQETFFWLFLSFVFILLSIFPGIADWFAGTLKVASPINLVFLIVIFLLIIKVFTMDRKIAKTEHQLVELTQRIAIDRLNEEQKKKTVSDE